MRIRLFVLIPLFFVISLSGKAQVKINFTEYDLNNGLHVILHQDKTAPIVAISVLYHVGSKNEQKGKTGFAHFLERLMFAGTKDIKPGQYYELVRDAGGELNANTSQDRTIFYEVLPSNQLDLGLWLESERMQYLKIDSSSVETTRKIIQQERMRRFTNQPYGDVLQQIFKHSYKVYPYGWVPLEPAQYVDHASIDEIKNFYNTYYVPNNATLSIAGNIDIDQTKKLVNEYFENIPKGANEIIRPSAVEPIQNKEIIDTVYESVKFPAVIEAYHIPAFTNKEFFSIYMIANLLSSGKDSGLYKSLVEDRHLAQQVEAYSFGLEAPGLFVTLGVANKDVDPNVLEIALNKDMDKIKNQLISKGELQELKNLIASRFVDANSSQAGLAENLAEFHALYGNTDLINTNLQSYLSITPKDIKNAAEKFLQKNNRVVLYYLPVSSQSNMGGN